VCGVGGGDSTPTSLCILSVLALTSKPFIVRCFSLQNMPKEAKFVTPQWIYSPWGSGWSVSAPAANKRFLIAFPTFLGVVSAITYYVETNCKVRYLLAYVSLLFFPTESV
jgi:hypothetical protein